MHELQPGSSNELILNPGEFAFLQDKTKGTVQTIVGPFVVTQSGQLRPIRFSKGAFQETTLAGAVEQCVSAEKGEYLILHNPTVEDGGLRHPQAVNNNAVVPDLRHGEKIVVPGPVQFALWPEQEARVVNGHNIRDDQFLVVRVYDEEAAVENWSDAVVKASDADETVATAAAEDLGLTIGKLLVIKNVSFYIPCTGIEVVADDDGHFVRDALTLEMSEYAILVDQSGNKRYERGPQIVFPEPTEEFFKDDGCIKFRPIELTPTQGLHIKINCDFTDRLWSDVGRKFTEGEEIFITGETHPIYYPCEEHSIVRYGSNLIHFATAVPTGQARYTMNKTTGEITTVNGPDMILLNPIDEVFVQRVLSDNESLLMYPGNTDSLDYNKSLRQFQVSSGSEGEALTSTALKAEYESFQGHGREAVKGGSRRNLVAKAALPDQITRNTSYTKPHSITLDDNRFNGVPTLKIWTGFAVLLVKADGTRRVEVGPKTVMLDYDETVQAMHLSTGRPKSTDNLITTGYLEVKNNKVGDTLEVQTEDGVRVTLEVSYRVTFIGDEQQWFNVDNYVKFLCDHARSLLKGAARRRGIRHFYAETVDIVRDTILGSKPTDGLRDGLLFPENGMTVTDMELLNIDISDEDIADLLSSQQAEVITNGIDIDRANQKLEVATARQRVTVETLSLEDKTRKVRHTLELAELEDASMVADLSDQEELLRAQARIEQATAAQETENVAHKSSLVRRTDLANLETKVEDAKTAQIVARFEAANGDLAAAIRELGDETVITKVAEAMGPMGLIGGVNLKDIVQGLIGSGGRQEGLFNRLNTLVDSDAD